MQLVDMKAKNNKNSPISTKTLPEKKDNSKNGIFCIKVSFIFAFYSLMLLLFYESVVDYLQGFGIWRQAYEIVFLIVITSAVIGILSGIVAVFKKKKLAWLTVLLNVLIFFIGIILLVIAVVVG